MIKLGYEIEKINAINSNKGKYWRDKNANNRKNK